MTTFSQLVDKMVLETRRPDMQADICSYLNQTIRELHFTPDNNKAVFFQDNLKEAILQATEATGFSWDVPVGVFQGPAACRYDSVTDSNGAKIWPKYHLSPNRAMEQDPYWYYRAGTRIFFYGYGGQYSTISFSWYEYPKTLFYFTVPNRPCTYDVYGFSYHEDFRANPLVDYPAAESACTNWLLQRWDQLIEEGLRAKIYKRLSDTERARTSYSMYTSLRSGLISSESADVAGTW